MYLCPKACIYTHRIYPNLKSISDAESFKVQCNQTLGCLRLYGDSQVSRAQPRINAHGILLQHDWLFIFSRQNRFAETHSHLQLSYHITDRLLVASNKTPCLYLLKNDNQDVNAFLLIYPSGFVNDIIYIYKKEQIKLIF